MNTEREISMSVRAIPAGHHTASPYLAIKNAVKALEFYKKAFGADEIYKLLMPDGRLGHADSIIMLADEFPEYGGKSPETLGGSPVSIHLWWVATHREDVSPTDMQKRVEAMFAQKK